MGGSLHGLYFWKDKNRACPLKVAFCALRARELSLFFNFGRLRGGRHFRRFLQPPDSSRPLIQRGGVYWHCAARREIAERSEEAPEAEAAQPL